MSEKHIVYQQSASSGARSLGCPGWSALTYYYRNDLPPEDKTYSVPGDAAHAHIEATLTGVQPKKKYKRLLKETDAKQKHFAAIAFAVRYIQKQIKKHGGKYASEAKVNIFPNYQFTGHIDLTHIHGTSLDVTDYKHGVGVPVKAFGNWQGVAYMWGAYVRLPPTARKAIKRFSFTVIQPRCMGVDPIQKWVLKEKELVKLVKHLQSGVANTHAILQTTITNDVKPRKRHLFKGDWCQFCPVKVKCPRWSEPVNRAIQQYKNDTQDHPDAYPDVTGKDLEQLVLDAVGVDNYLKKAKDMVAVSIAKGKGAGLCKTVPGNMRTSISTSGVQVLDKALKRGRITREQYNACFSKDFATLAVLKQSLPVTLYKKITQVSRNKPSIVSMDDKRKSTAEVAAGKFKNG